MRWHVVVCSAADRGMCMNGFGITSASWRDWHVSMCDGKVTCQTESLFDGQMCGHAVSGLMSFGLNIYIIEVRNDV